MAQNIQKKVLGKVKSKRGRRGRRGRMGSSKMIAAKNKKVNAKPVDDKSRDEKSGTYYD